MNLKQLIEVGFFEKDDAGFYLVPNNNPHTDEPSRVLSTIGPGDYPLIGVGPGGYALQWDEDGVARRDTALLYDLSDEEVEGNSLTMPASMVSTRYVVIDDQDIVLDIVETLGEACDLAIANFGDKIIRVTVTSFHADHAVGAAFEQELVEDYAFADA